MSGVFCSGVLGEVVTPNDVRRKKEMGGGGEKAWEGSTEEIPTEIHSQEN